MNTLQTSARKRISLPGGTYYTARRAEPPHVIFSDPRDYEDFDVFLAQTLKRTGTEILGYCWMPDAIHLALVTRVTPIGEVMSQVTRYCAQRIRKRTGGQVGFIGSFPIKLTDPESHLPMLLRYIHYIPVVAGVAATLTDYPYSSHRAYAGKQQDLPAGTTALQKLIRAPRLH